MYQISLVAAFVAGAVALFAPCCISYLLPSYFASVFRERRKILLMTAIYSLGIFTVMLPVILGAKALSAFFFRLHDETYLVGSALLVIIALITLLGIKLPMPAFKKSKPAVDAPSTFLLGIMSGITASCCAPVLVGVITLSALTPTTIQAIGVGISYVLGMVAPLYFASALIEKKNILSRAPLRKSLYVLQLGEYRFPIIMGNVIAATVFFLSGILMFILTLQGKLGMNLVESETTKKINTVALSVTRFLGSSRLIDTAFILLLALIIYRFFSERKND